MIVFMKAIAFYFLMLAVSFSCFAKVKHISLHEIESNEQESLSVKLNIVEQNKTAIKFTLVNQNIESPLAYQRINDYMIRLTSTHHLQGEATINVYQQDDSLWLRIYEIALNTKSFLQNSDKSIITKAKKPEVIKATSISPVIANQVATNVNSKKCFLTRSPKETLWSIASRYKATWQLDVYSAMFVIYKRNPNQFRHQHIAKLIHGAELKCPTENDFATLGTKAQMAQQFNQLNSKAN